jgi:hypothetical protein
LGSRVKYPLIVPWLEIIRVLFLGSRVKYPLIVPWLEIIRVLFLGFRVKYPLIVFRLEIILVSTSIPPINTPLLLSYQILLLLRDKSNQIKSGNVLHPPLHLRPKN